MEENKEYKRFTISLPKRLYESFEKFRDKLEMSRSDAIRKAMHSFMISEEDIYTNTANIIGCIIILMSHEHPDIKEENHVHDSSQVTNHDHDYASRSMYTNIQQTDEILKIDIQHHFFDVIISTMHVHLEYEKCLEIVAVSGAYDRVKKLKEDLLKLKSVISVGFFIIEKETNSDS